MNHSSLLSCWMVEYSLIKLRGQNDPSPNLQFYIVASSVSANLKTELKPASYFQIFREVRFSHHIAWSLMGLVSCLRSRKSGGHKSESREEEVSRWQAQSADWETSSDSNLNCDLLCMKALPCQGICSCLIVRLRETLFIASVSWTANTRRTRVGGREWLNTNHGNVTTTNRHMSERLTQRSYKNL